MKATPQSIAHEIVAAHNGQNLTEVLLCHMEMEALQEIQALRAEDPDYEYISVPETYAAIRSHPAVAAILEMVAQHKLASMRSDLTGYRPWDNTITRP